jgi:Gpi18-like mannosyltransferase
MLGALSGLCLAILIGYSVRLVWQPLSAQERARSLGPRVAAILAAIALAKIAALFFFPGFKWDVANAQRWSMALAQGGPAHVYDAAVRCDYPPGGYLYLLWLAGTIARGLSLKGDGLRVLVETPAVVVDAVAALVVFAAARRLGYARYAFGAMLAFALNPALVYDSVVWGQKDSVLMLPVLLSVTLAIDGRYALAWALAATAMLVKPQGCS